MRHQRAKLIGTALMSLMKASCFSLGLPLMPGTAPLSV